MRLLSLFVLLAGLGFAQTDTGSPAPTSPTEKVDRLVALVNDVPVTRSYFDYQFEIFVRQSVGQQGGGFETGMLEQFASYRPQYLERLTNEISLVQYAKKRGLTPSNEEVEKIITDAQSHFPDEAALKDALSEHGIPSIDAYRQLVADGLATQKLYEYYYNLTKPSEASMHYVYASNKSKAVVPEQRCASHILVEDEATAQAILVRLKTGEAFPALAQEFSIDTSNKDKGGDLGCQGKGAFVPEFETAEWALAEGDFTAAPVKTQFGYHIVFLNKAIAKGVKSYEDSKAEIETSIKEEVSNRIIDRIMKSATIQLFPEALQDEVVSLEPEVVSEEGDVAPAETIAP